MTNGKREGAWIETASPSAKDALNDADMPLAFCRRC